MNDGLLPERKMPKLIVVAAFDRGEYGPPTTLFQVGEDPDME